MHVHSLAAQLAPLRLADHERTARKAARQAARRFAAHPRDRPGGEELVARLACTVLTVTTNNQQLKSHSSCVDAHFKCTS